MARPISNQVWTDAMVAEALALSAHGHTHAQIAKALGLTERQVRFKFYDVRAKHRAERKPIWNDQNWARAQELRAAGMTFDLIAADIGLTKSQVYHRFYPLERGGNTNAVRAEAPNNVIIERDRAHQAERSLTASICGDPRPGRSALDRRQSR